MGVLATPRRPPARPLRVRARRRRLACLALAALALAGCGGDGYGDDGGTTTQATPFGATTAKGVETLEPPESREPVTVRAYFVDGEKVAAVAREVPATQGVGVAALRELLSGPRGDDEDRLTTAIDPGTKVESLAIDDGVAKVDLGDAELDDLARAQVVYTLTQFPSVDSVVIAGEQPQTRADYEEQTPQILIETPTPGADIDSPLRIAGTANTFEAAFTVRLVGADGGVLAEKPVTATSGSGVRGTFEEELQFDVDGDTPVTLVAFEQNMGEGEGGGGAELHRVEVPITLVP